MDEFRFVGSTPTELEGGRPIEPGEFTGPIDVSEKAPANKTLLDEGMLLKVSSETAEQQAAREKQEAEAKEKQEEEQAAAANAEAQASGDKTAGKAGEGK
jgi:hypothetical protein